MALTPNLSLAILEEGQSKAEVTVNESLVVLDALGFFPVKTIATTPPATPANGDVHLVGTSGATGAWTGKENNVAIYNGGWRFVAPKEGMRVHRADNDVTLLYTGSAWVSSGQVADLNQTISGTYTQSEVQAISDKVDELLAALRTGGWVRP